MEYCGEKLILLFQFFLLPEIGLLALKDIPILQSTMSPLTKDLIFRLTPLEGRTFDSISQEYHTDRRILSEWDQSFAKERPEEVKKVERIRGLFHSKKNKKGFKFSTIEL